MKNSLFFALAIIVMAMASNSNAQVTIEAIDIRGTGVFGDGTDDPAMGVYLNHLANASAITLGGAALPGSDRTPADPIEIQLTYSNLDLDGDSTPNDAVTFTIRWEKVDFDNDGLDGAALATFGQGIDTGFGNLNDLQVSVTNVSGTTTDSGATIFFDGFTGAGLGGGSGMDLDRTAEVNGTTLTFASASTGTFQFITQMVDFTATPTIMIDNSGDTDLDGMGDGGFGSIVARNYDLQFSLTDPNMGGPLKGDIDLSGSVTFLDINPFITVLATNSFQAEADCDCDGDVDFLDIQPFINILAGNP